MAVQPAIRLTAPTGEHLDLGTRGPVTDAQWESVYAGGPTDASCRVGLPATTQHPALAMGAKVALHRGLGQVWTGKTATVDREQDPWQLKFDGIAAAASNAPASRSGTLQQIVQAGIDSGALPWTIDPAQVVDADALAASGLDLVWAGADGGIGKTPIADVLNQVLLRRDRRWTVTPAGVFATQADPTIPSLIVDLDQVLRTTWNAYATVVTLRYTSVDDPAGTTIKRSVVRRNETAIARFGVVPKTVNAGDSRVSEATAIVWADRYLARVAPRLVVAGEHTIRDGQVRTATGAALDLGSAQLAGQLAQVRSARMVTDSVLSSADPVHMLIGSARFDATTGLMTLGADGRALTPEEQMFGGRGGGAA